MSLWKPDRCARIDRTFGKMPQERLRAKCLPFIKQRRLDVHATVHCPTAWKHLQTFLEITSGDVGSQNRRWKVLVTRKREVLTHKHCWRLNSSG